jgi:hypothetical protein
MSPEKVTTLLDLAGLALLAFGAGAALFPLIGWASTAGAALVLLGGSRAIVWVAAPELAPRWWRWLRGERR